MLYAYGMPFILVSLNAGLTATFQTDSMIGYGGHVCFLNQTISIIVTFMVPVLLVCLSNIYFFAMTAKTITATMKLAHKQQIESNKSQFTVYVKLFTITGITWIFQIIDSLFPTTLDENVFSAIVSVLNALQGVFIFLSYICNNQVLMLCKRKTPRLYHTKNSYSPSVKTNTTDYWFTFEKKIKSERLLIYTNINTFDYIVLLVHILYWVIRLTTQPSDHWTFNHWTVNHKTFGLLNIRTTVLPDHRTFRPSKSRATELSDHWAFARPKLWTTELFGLSIRIDI